MWRAVGKTLVGCRPVADSPDWRTIMRGAAWRYRDYGSLFNQDKAYDQFIREADCGDEGPENLKRWLPWAFENGAGTTGGGGETGPTAVP